MRQMRNIFCILYITDDQLLTNDHCDPSDPWTEVNKNTCGRKYIKVTFIIILIAVNIDTSLHKILTDIAKMVEVQITFELKKYFFKPSDARAGT